MKGITETVRKNKIQINFELKDADSMLRKNMMWNKWLKVCPASYEKMCASIQVYLQDEKLEREANNC